MKTPSLAALLLAPLLLTPAALANDSVGVCGPGLLTGANTECYGASLNDCRAEEGTRAGVSQQAISPGWGTKTTCFAFVIVGAQPTYDTRFDGTCVQTDGYGQTVCAGVLTVYTQYGASYCAALWYYDGWSYANDYGPRCVV